ncbi:MAG: BMP family ABC transporter substrate-binding protein [Clostridia bacterium]|nr:BMP family ABC transporter substrate-binding protein [Clostridia bacterium]
MKKILTIILVIAILASFAAVFAACSGSDEFKVGIICLHDESSTYDNNFIQAAKDAAKELGLKDSQVIIKTGIDEDTACYETAKELAEMGCKMIFADSFGHEKYMIQAAKEYTDVQFCHATGTKAHTEKLANYHNAFASIYEGRYLAGVAAGMKLNEMIAAGTITAEQAKMGYVGAYTYAEVISGYTSFYLGAKSICPSVTMEVQFTGSWFDIALEKAAAENLMSRNCVLISQHADSMGAPSACELAGVPNVSYNGSTIKACPNTFIVASRINWVPYFKLIMKAAQDGTAIPTDYTGTIADGSVVLTDVNTTAAAAGTADKIAEVKAKLMDGTINVFDTNTFTVTIVPPSGAEGDFGTNTSATVDANKKLTSYIADVDDLGDYIGETEVVADGAFKESKFRSAPYFDIKIDGITLLNSKM